MRSLAVYVNRRVDGLPTRGSRPKYLLNLNPGTPNVEKLPLVNMRIAFELLGNRKTYFDIDIIEICQAVICTKVKNELLEVSWTN